MQFLRSILFLLYFSIPFSAAAAVTADELPQGTLWYLHADLAEMRTAAVGEGIYDWLDGEVFMDIHEDIGVDINKEMDSITAYSNEESGTVILIEGAMRTETQERLIKQARMKTDLTEMKHKGKTYFFATGDDHDSDDEDEDDEHHAYRSSRREPMRDLKDGAYFSFAVKNKLLVTGSEEQMQELLDNKGKIAGGGNHDGALFVLTAEKAFVQAGLNTDGFNDNRGWDSNILRNTEQAALTIAGVEDMISIEARLVSTDPDMAQSLGGIANGLISLQAFNDDLDPDIKSLLANTKVDVNDNVLSISMVITPDLIVDVLED